MRTGLRVVVGILLLVGVFASLFLRERRHEGGHSSAERSALMPLSEDGPARPAGEKDNGGEKP